MNVLFHGSTEGRNRAARERARIAARAAYLMRLVMDADELILSGHLPAVSP